MNSKMITIDYRGFIQTSRGRVWGPIQHPYRESCDVIFSMIAKNIKVYEETPGGKVLLTSANFDRVNYIPPKKETKVVTTVKTAVDPRVMPDQKSVNELKTPTVKTTVKEAVKVEEPAKETPVVETPAEDPIVETEPVVDTTEPVVTSEEATEEVTEDPTENTGSPVAEVPSNNPTVNRNNNYNKKRNKRNRYRQPDGEQV